jgi:hypothetical protein
MVVSLSARMVFMREKGVKTMEHTTSQNERRGMQSTGSLSLWVVSLLTISAATMANLIARAIAFTLLPLSPTFEPLAWQSVILFTVVGVALACGVYALVRRFSRKAVRVYTLIAVIALLISLIPDVLILRDPVAFEADTTISEVAVMMVFHGVAAIVSLVLLTRLAPPAQNHS